jgi:rhamnogalacturonyl hydrolase YesR
MNGLAEMSLRSLPYAAHAGTDKPMDDILKILTSVLDAAHQKGYSGFSKFDALNSPFLNALSLNSKWLRLAFTQLVKESPINLRPLFGVKESRNPKGIALFARAYLSLYKTTGALRYLERGEDLILWLLENPSTGYQHLCWGYNHIWQNTIFLQQMYEPNAVVSVFAGEALLCAYETTGNNRYLSAARSVADFILLDLPVLYHSSDELAIAYVLREVDAVVLNNQVLAGAFLTKLWRHTGESRLIEAARRLINYTVNRRTDYHAWYYTYPMEKSRITHDNYHTGGILDGLIEYYEQTGDDRYLQVYWQGLEFYRANLFEPDGSPRWMSDRKYPFDVHGSAQGIISFKKADRHEPRFLSEAEKIAGWAIANLYREGTCDFAYRRGRWFRWNYSLMRWCNAWMARALAELVEG